MEARCSPRMLGLLVCCGQVFYFLLTGEGGYFTKSFSGLVGSQVEKDQQPAQRAATAALKKLLHEEEIAFDTDYTTRESVLRKGFPLRWKQCTLQPLLPVHFALGEEEQENEKFPGVDLSPTKPMHLVVLGGSSSAHSGKNCSYESRALPANDTFAGRYSNILMHELYEDFFRMEGDSTLEFDVTNMAQGATDTVWNALMLDELIDLHADVLIVEYGINDALGGTTKHHYRTDKHLEQMMNLWLWRVYSFFQSANQTPPPILFVFLWDANFYKPAGDGTFDVNTDHLIQQGIGQTSWKAQRRVLEHYRELGWSIGAINVGAAIDNIAVAKDPYVLLDDKHHPNCGSMHLISAMIRHAIYTDLIKCTVEDYPGSNHHNASRTSIRPMKIPKRDQEGDAHSSELYQLLLQENVKVGSIMEWEPNQQSSSLSLGPDSDFFNASTKGKIQADHGTKSFPWRADRKRSFTLGHCTNAKDAVHFTLSEPGLQWLGLGYHILPNDAASTDATTVIEMTINEIPIHLSELEENSKDINHHDINNKHIHNHTILEFDEALVIKQWIKLTDYLPQPLAPQHNLTFCYKTLHPLPNLPLWEDCPYFNANSVPEACEIWDRENFDRTQTCPYARYQDVSEICFQWFDEALEEHTKEATEPPEPKEAKDFPTPQLNWIVGVVAT